MSRTLWVQLLETPPDELREWIARRDPPKVWTLYGRVLEAHHFGDREELAHAAEHLERIPEGGALARLARLRLALRFGKDKKQLRQAISAVEEAERSFQPHERGERDFVLGMSYGQAGSAPRALKCYASAEAELERIGAERKAIKARMNQLVQRSRKDTTSRRRITEYVELLRRARTLGERGVAALCCVNIAREHQRIGALPEALRFSGRALRFARKDPGTLNFFRVLVQRCELFFEAARNSEAEYLFEECLAAPFPEIQAALEVIRARYGETRVPLETLRFALSPAWRERLESNAPKVRFTEQESRVVRCLALRPLSSAQLARRVFPGKAPLEHKLRSMSVVLAKIRRKDASILLFENGLYWLNSKRNR